MKGEISTLKAMDENIEKQISALQKEEENGSNDYKNKINSLKNELESKEFTIQNMERLYIELEDVIKDNIEKGNEQLLTMEQFSNFLNQNNKLKEDIKQLEQEKIKLDEKYSQVLKENVMLRKKDAKFDKDNLDDILKSYDKEKNKTGKEEALKKINEYKIKQQKVNNEYNDIKNKIEKLILVLKGMNIDNKNFNEHLKNIQNELISNELDIYQNRKRYNSVSYHKNRMKMKKDLKNFINNKNIKGNKKKDINQSKKINKNK